MRSWLIISCALFIMGCQSNVQQSSTEAVKMGLNHLGMLPVPEDNLISEERIELGKKLFFDDALSLDSSLSCATCHSPEKAFTDGLEKSEGINLQIVDRNAPSLINIGYHSSFLRDGTLPGLEQQVLVPFQEHKEFNLNIVLAAERLRKDSSYNAMALKAYDREMSPYVIARALATFQRTLNTASSRFDRYYYGKKEGVLNDSELKGFELFKSDRLKCVECHELPHFTNFTIQNNGWYSEYVDPGRKRLTLKDEDEGMFKVPSLRNLKNTGPYMHDGSAHTLEEIIDHYAQGGKGHKNQSELIKGFELTPKEKEQLIDFLNSLNDPNAIKF